MRSIPLLIAAAAAASSCSMSAGPTQLPMRTVAGQHQLDLLLAGKVPQQTISCVPSTRDNDMRVIDANTIAFRSGGTVYLVGTSGCTNLSSNGMSTLVTRNYGGTGICRGDVAEVLDSAGGLPIGSCMINSVTPFVPAR